MMMWCLSLAVSFICLGFPKEKVVFFTEATSCGFEGTDFLVVMPQTYPQNKLRTHVITILGVPGGRFKYWAPGRPSQIAVIQEDSSVNLTFRESMLNANFTDNATAVQQLAVRLLRLPESPPLVVYVHTEHGDGYLALPKRPKATVEFVVASFPVQGDCMTYIAIATFDHDNMVEIELKLGENETAFIGNKSIENSQPFNFTLTQRNDVLIIRSSGEMTGTKIIGIKPVSVFSGITCACVLPGRKRCHGIIEQIPRIQKLGDETILPPLPQMFDTRYLRAVAAANGTLTFMGDQSRMEEGEWRDWDIKTAVESPRSTGKFLLLQTFRNGATLPTTLIASHAIVPPNGFAKYFRVLAVPGYETELSVLHSKSPSGLFSLIINGVERYITEFSVTYSEFVGFTLEVSEGVLDIQSADKDADMQIYIYSYGPQAMHSFPAACVKELPNISRSYDNVEIESMETSSSEQLSSEDYNTVTNRVKSHHSTVGNVSLFEQTSEEQLTTERGPLTTEEVPLTTEIVPLTTEIVPLTTEEVPLTTERVPLTTEEVPLTTEEVPLTTEIVPLTTERVPLTTDGISLTPKGVSSKTEAEPFTMEAVQLVTKAVLLATEEISLISLEGSSTADERPLVVELTNIDHTVASTINIQPSSIDGKYTMNFVQPSTEPMTLSTTEEGTYSSTDFAPGCDTCTPLTTPQVRPESQDTGRDVSGSLYNGRPGFNGDEDSYAHSPTEQLQTLFDTTSSRTEDIQRYEMKSSPQQSQTSLSVLTSDEMPHVPSSEDRITRSTMCPCFANVEELSSLMSMKRSKLLLNTKLLTDQIRKKTSAPDDRASSKNVGAVGITLVVIPVVAVVFADVKLLIWR